MSLKIESHKLNLDLHQNTYTAFIGKQFNSGETAEITVYNNGKLFEIGNSLITFKVETPNHKFYEFKNNCNWCLCGKDDYNAVRFDTLAPSEKTVVSTFFPDVTDDNYVCYEEDIVIKQGEFPDEKIIIRFPQALFYAKGRAEAELVIFNGEQMATMSFTFKIVASVYDDEAVIESAYPQDQVTALKQYVDNAIYITTENAKAAEESAEAAKESEINASNSEMNAQMSETNATISESNAKDSEDNAKESEINAKASANAAKKSELKAADSETNAQISESNALASEENARESELNAKDSEEKAYDFKEKAEESARAAKESETNAKVSEDAAAISEEEAEKYAIRSQSYAVGGTQTRTDEDTDNSKYYYSQVKEMFDKLPSTLFPIVSKASIVNVIQLPDGTYIDDEGDIPTTGTKAGIYLKLVMATGDLVYISTDKLTSGVLKNITLDTFTFKADSNGDIDIDKLPIDLLYQGDTVLVLNAGGAQ